MKLLFIRHGEPDYVHDTLTEKGWREARLLAERIAPLDVKQYYVSPLGRAQDTARPTLERAGRTAVTLEDLVTSDGAPLPAGTYLIKVRSAAKAQPAYFNGENTLVFEEPVRAPAPGQTAAFYRDGAVVGSGFIRRAE